jgi:hypothetical protein
VVAATLGLAGCSERPHEGVKLMPRAAMTAVGEPASVAQANPPAAVAPAQVLAKEVATPSPAAEEQVTPATLPGRLDGATAPLLVLPGEPTGNDRFRQAMKDKLERQAATP